MTALLIHSNFIYSLPNNFGTTPLHWTSSKGYEQLAELLLKNKADVNYVDAYVLNINSVLIGLL